MRPINNVVDVTNYVMLARRPAAARLRPRPRSPATRSSSRRSRPGEKIVTLDGIERPLQPDNLVIADAGRPLVIAGIFGAVDAEIDDTTRDLVLEAATFDGPSIMRTSKEVGWRSEASSRFEKGLDISYVPQGLSMASRLLHELCGGAVAPGTVDVLGAPAPARPRIDYRPAASDRLLGLAIGWQEQADILRRLDCEVEGDEDLFFVTPPSFRPDLEREVDLIEEVGRLHGLGRVPETFPLRRDAIGALTSAQRARRVVRRTLAGSGLDEIVTWSFVSREALGRLDLSAGDRRAAPIAVANPMTAEHAVMRTTLLPGLMATVRDNLATLNFPVGLFEQGRVYLASAEEAGAAPATPAGDDGGAAAEGRAGEAAGFARFARPWPATEPEAVAIVVCGPTFVDAWTGPARATDFYTLKGHVERLCEALGVEPVFTPSREPFLHPGKSADVSVGSTRLGWLGLVRPDVVAASQVEGHEVYAAELVLDAFVELGLPTALFTEVSAYPPANQDLAVVVSEEVTAAQVVALVRKAGGKLVAEAHVFDVYAGEQVPEGKRSLAVRVVMSSPERTLAEKDIASVRAKIVGALEREFEATLR